MKLSLSPIEFDLFCGVALDAITEYFSHSGSLDYSRCWKSYVDKLYSRHYVLDSGLGLEIIDRFLHYLPFRTVWDFVSSLERKEV